MREDRGAGPDPIFMVGVLIIIIAGGILALMHFS